MKANPHWRRKGGEMTCPWSTRKRWWWWYVRYQHWLTTLCTNKSRLLFPLRACLKALAPLNLPWEVRRDPGWARVCWGRPERAMLGGQVEGVKTVSLNLKRQGRAAGPVWELSSKDLGTELAAQKENIMKQFMSPHKGLYARAFWQRVGFLMKWWEPHPWKYSSTGQRGAFGGISP